MELTDNIYFCPKCGKKEFTKVDGYKDWFKCFFCELGYVIRVYSKGLEEKLQ